MRLEHVLEYAQPLPSPVAIADDEVVGAAAAAEGGGCEAAERGGSYERGAGYCFMDSPGNDLESIAGQVASGCNLIYFTTGNGSITNFPFVPTIKVVSTSHRYNLMSNDMDVDAGAPGTRAELGTSLLDLTLKVASGARTKGETSGHHQVQIWRSPNPNP